MAIGAGVILATLGLRGLVRSRNGCSIAPREQQGGDKANNRQCGMDIAFHEVVGLVGLWREGMIPHASLYEAYGSWKEGVIGW